MNQTENLELISDVIKKLSGKNSYKWYSAIQHAIHKKEYWGRIGILPDRIPVQKLTAKTLKRRVLNSGCEIDNYVEDMMMHKDFYASRVKANVKFAIIQTNVILPSERKEYGGKYPIEEFLEKLENHPLYELCEHSDPFFVRLNYHNQPLDERLITAMKPITISKTGKPGGVFVLYTDDQNSEYIYSYQHYDTSQLRDKNLWLVRVK